ncbi:MAG TPA: hypothetical protein VII60_03865, partial [Acidimicrobiales bacterium]
SAPALLDILLDELEPRRVRLDSAEGRVQLREEYVRALATLGQRVRVEQRSGALVGTATSIDDMGQLVLDVDGDEIAFSVGDVVHVRPDDGSRT